MKCFLSLFLLLAGLGAAGWASAALTINIREQGGNVVMTVYGTYDFSTLSQTSTNTPFVAGIQANPLSFGAGAATNNLTEYSGANCSGSLGSGSTLFVPNTTSGNLFDIEVSDFYIPNSSGPIGTYSNTIATYNGATLASLGLTNGATLTCSWPGDSLTVNVVVAVPTLSEWAQLMLALMVIGVAWHFHNNRQNSY